MNIITYAHAISLYPQSTFLEGMSYQNKALRLADDAAFEKYRGRGFSYLSRDEAMTRAEFRFQRRVGDKFSWIIPLRGDHPLPRLPKDDLVFVNTWGIASPGTSYMFDYELLRNRQLPEASVCLAKGKRRSLQRHRGQLDLEML